MMDGGKDISLLLKWTKWHAALILLATLATLFLEDTRPLAFSASLSFLYYIGSHFPLLKNLRPLGGYANWVTTIRLLLLLAALFFWAEMGRIPLLAALLLFVSLDAVDGWLARKFKQTTTFGQYYDMELDALFVLFACLALYLDGKAGAWLLLPGGLRYIFVLHSWLFKKHKKEKRQKYAAVIAGIFFTMLLFSLALQHPLQQALLALSGMAIIASFGISFYQIHRP